MSISCPGVVLIYAVLRSTQSAEWFWFLVDSVLSPSTLGSLTPSFNSHPHRIKATALFPANVVFVSLPLLIRYVAGRTRWGWFCARQRSSARSFMSDCTSYDFEVHHMRHFHASSRRKKSHFCRSVMTFSGLACSRMPFLHYPA